MKRDYYIFSGGKLIRKDNTLYFEPGEQSEPEEKQEYEIEIEDEAIEEEKEEKINKLPRKPLPVEDIDSIYCFGEMRFNTKFFNFLAQSNIPLHIFNYYGYYSGTFSPRQTLLSGKLLVKQVDHYQASEKRIKLAKKFVEGATDNILKNLLYHNSREKDMSVFLEKIKEQKAKIEMVNTIQELMGIEGGIRSLYYTSWHLIINETIDFAKREKHPPTNPINALISFGNSMVYTNVLKEIYKTQLNPLISFLHEPGARRFSLSLDISEIFKPLLADRIIFSLINKKMIQEKHFTKNMNMCHLNEEGRKIFVREFDEKLKTTIKHRKLNRSVSYGYLIRLECYKIIKHLLGERDYEPFKIWW